ncbi:hypothetical protein HXX76_013296 [Chlamydomonas incerta]|uniref:Trichohyalin-plectin-homology domain-containing protein n=1 Tax=Chlamydomonas incerta TaxID=51695 RepID=A0A835VQX9_CHLIN|nr:hypothetical protein HXX76_013296 [Chlamydomonas incerta]|eukprot:KAG2425922.1 hypothetical protein HXX76_013296 [Chlamydomonas incerta]
MQYVSIMSSRPAKTKDTDLALLEERIRIRLVGGTPGKSSLVEAKRGEAGDEWLAMFEYEQALGVAKSRLDAEARAAKQAALRETLKEQMADRDRQAEEERRREEEYWKQEQEAIRKGEEEAEAKRKLQQEIMIRLKHDRLQQMDDRIQRRDAALARKRAEESVDASRTAYETAEELRLEEEQRTAAKIALREFLLQNESNKAIREEAKKRQWAEDAQFQKQWEEKLNKQEADRREQLDKVKRQQAKLQAMADAQGENRRRWLETPLVNKYYKEREDARAAEEERRVAHQKDVARKITVDLEQQLREREESKARLKKEEEAYAASVAAKVAAAEEAERARKAAIAAKKAAFKESIEQQMQAKAMRKQAERQPMTEVERQINRKTLEDVGTWHSTGRIPLPQLRNSTAASSLSK